MTEDRATEGGRVKALRATRFEEEDETALPFRYGEQEECEIPAEDETTPSFRYEGRQTF